MKTIYPSAVIPRYLPIILVASLSSGCTEVPVYEQELVSRIGMIRTDSMVEGDQINLI